MYQQSETVYRNRLVLKHLAIGTDTYPRARAISLFSLSYICMHAYHFPPARFFNIKLFRHCFKTVVAVIVQELHGEKIGNRSEV